MTRVSPQPDDPNERPPPVASRLLATLRDAFLPPAVAEYLHREYELWRMASRSALDEFEPQPDDERDRLLAQRHIADELIRNPERFTVRETFRKYWAAGRPSATPGSGAPRGDAPPRGTPPAP